MCGDVKLEGFMKKSLVDSGLQSFKSKNLSEPKIHAYVIQASSLNSTECSSSLVYLNMPELAIPRRKSLKVCATRRRRVAYQRSETYVLLEPGKDERFVSEDELRDILKGWLENWPGAALPPDLTSFESIDDAVQYLVKSVCELEIDGDVGSVQWYEVRLE